MKQKHRRYKYKVTKLNDASFAITDSYKRLYPKNWSVYAKKGTFGLMVFKTRYLAEDFVHYVGCIKNFKIKKVIPIGRGSTPKLIVVGDSVRDFYENGRDERLRPPPPGTICYPGLFVRD